MDNKKLLLVAAAAAAVASSGAQAQVAGTWFGGIGVTRIAPNTSSGTLSPPAAPNTTVDIGADTKPTLFIGRMVTDHWSWEVPIGFGFEHDINGTGGISGCNSGSRRIVMLKASPIRTIAGALVSPTPGSNAIAAPTLASTSAKAGAQVSNSASVGLKTHR